MLLICSICYLDLKNFTRTFPVSQSKKVFLKTLTQDKLKVSTMTYLTNCLEDLTGNFIIPNLYTCNISVESLIMAVAVGSFRYDDECEYEILPLQIQQL